MKNKKELSVKDKYRPFPPVNFKQRTWPNKQTTTAPIWCSVDLRDGNQALINPLNQQQKLELFKLLCAIGFQQIEIGFPSASQTEYDFTRHLIENKLIPAQVIPQVLCQARESLIERTFAALAGCSEAIFHVYNSTSTLQRRVVFQKDRQEIIQIAVEAVKLIKKLSDQHQGKIILQYSPESFTGTELDFAKEICEAVLDTWDASPERQVIINLPATVELHTPNIYADQIEWFCTHVEGRNRYILSVHTHNDRGTGIAASELALLAGADRVEGTLFGNGERTGNVDIVTMALNLWTQGIDPKLDFSNLMAIRETAERLTEIRVHERHPYAGDLVFTAFSGSHQDAIKKGLDCMKNNPNPRWEVPYLPIDPHDLGRDYEAIIRINSQSGKGGIAYILEREFNYRLPKAMHPEVSQQIQTISDQLGTEISANRIKEEFIANFVNLSTPIQYQNFIYNPSRAQPELFDCQLTIKFNGQTEVLAASGNGPISACKHALDNFLNANFALKDFSQHALSSGSSAEAISYIQIQDLDTGTTVYGAGIDANTDRASIKALISAINKILNKNVR